MTNSFTKQVSAPISWLATAGASLIALIQLAPSMSVSILCAAVLSASIIVLVSRSETNEESKVVPHLGAGLFAFMIWIVVSLVPVSSVEVGAVANSALIARTVVALIACVLLMPLLALAETIFSVAVVQVVSRASGGSVLSGELRVVSLLEQKFGGLLGGINR